MHQISRRGIYYNLEISPYCFYIEYITFYFSSKLHMKKFLDRFEDYCKCFRETFHQRTKIHYDNYQLIALLLYEKIETRGFYIEMKGEKYTCPNSLKFVGNLEKKTSLNEKSTISTEEDALQ